jgi:hypothetical protein
MWLNVTLHGMSELYVVIRQTEFAILRVNQNLDELVDAIQCVLLGKLPINLVSPDTLHNILVNTSRYLVENYEWFAGSKFENLYIYYDMFKVAIVGDTHSIRLILNVSLKTTNRNFVLYKLIAFLMPVLNNTFVQYKPNYLYFGFNEIQHSYALFRRPKSIAALEAVLQCVRQKEQFIQRKL